MPGIDFREVRARVTMAEVLQLLGFEGHATSATQRRGRCPLHGSAERSRVFSVNLAKNAFRCFKCGAAGNHLDLWARASNQPLHKAALDLCQRLQREIPWLPAETEKRNP
jgi:DNA primase